MLSIVVLLSSLYGVMTSTQCRFPSGFEFGTATSSYQIEGGWNASEKSPSVWDIGVHNHPEKIADHSTGDIACDSYNQIDTDIENLKFLKVSFYRFSINWPRLLPNGDASFINPDGVRYYNELINKLIANNIEPMITIFHWELPQVLQEIGGWTNPDIVEYFQQFARTCYTLFGDRVKKWLTANEISTYCVNAYNGLFAPFANSPGIGTYLCAHNILLSHGYAYRMYKKDFAHLGGEVGIAMEMQWYYPATNSAEDKAAAKRAIASSVDWLAHPILSKEGDYPSILRKIIDKASAKENRTVSRLPRFTCFEKKLLRGSFDFFGVNHYTSLLIKNPPSPINYSTPNAITDTQVLYSFDPTWPTTSRSFFRVVPDGIRQLLNHIKNRYNNPKVYITENGFAGFPDETVDDDERINYNEGYLTAVLKAINEDGCNVKAYTAWSFMDNFEWHDGYTKRFGLFHVNFNDSARTRIPKKSALNYKEIITSGKINNCKRFNNMADQGTRKHTGRTALVYWINEKQGPTGDNIWF